MLHLKRTVLALLGVVVLSSACSFPYLRQSKNSDQSIAQINLEAVRFFRPDYEIADWDDFSQKNRKLECISPHELWKSFLLADNTKDLIECLNVQTEPVSYLYVPKVQPTLDLDPLVKHPPDCLKTYLPSLPLPREVYFLGRTEKLLDQEVYEISFDSKADQVLNTKLRSPRFPVVIEFPLIRKLKTTEDLEIWFLVTVLSLLETEHEMKASLVPEIVWKQCFKDDAHFLDKKNRKIPPLFWP